MIVYFLLCLFVGFALMDVFHEIKLLKGKIDKLINVIGDYRIEEINLRSKNNEDN